MQATAATISKLVLQGLGTLIGLGGGFVIVTWIMMLSSPWKLGTMGMVGWGVGLTIAGYCLRVAYLIWRNFSPLAMRHVCGCIWFAFLMGTASLIYPWAQQTVEPQPWAILVFVGLFLLTRLLYRATTRRLGKMLFSPATPGRNS